MGKEGFRSDNYTAENWSQSPQNSTRLLFQEARKHKIKCTSGGNQFKICKNPENQINTADVPFPFSPVPDLFVLSCELLQQRNNDMP